jgi:hypothetical protein
MSFVIAGIKSIVEQRHPPASGLEGWHADADLRKRASADLRCLTRSRSLARRVALRGRKRGPLTQRKRSGPTGRSLEYQRLRHVPAEVFAGACSRSPMLLLCARDAPSAVIRQHGEMHAHRIAARGASEPGIVPTGTRSRPVQSVCRALPAAADRRNQALHQV